LRQAAQEAPAQMPSSREIAEATLSSSSVRTIPYVQFEEKFTEFQDHKVEEKFVPIY
jgi:hypothetical protein